MPSSTITITTFTVTNQSDREMNLMLEPEGDVIQVPCGKACQIKAESTPKAEVDCEIESASNGDLTLYLSVTKEVYVDGERVR